MRRRGVGAEPGRRVAIAFHEPVVGGASIAVLRVLPLLEVRGWTFAFWTPPGPLERRLREMGYPVFGEPRHLRYSLAALRVSPGPVRRLASVPGYLRRFRHWVREQAPDVLHANTLITLPEAVAARGTGVPTMLYVHEILPDDRRGAAAGRLIRRFTDAVITNSAASVAALRRAGVEPHESYYGVELPPRPGTTRPATESVVVGTLGTISHRKGSDIFLDAAERVTRELPEVRFRMVGPRPEGPEGPWADAMIERARSAGVDWHATDDAFTELAEWDLLVLPSRSEPFGLVVIEAMAMCLPVVASRLDGPQEILTEGTGVLVEPGDSAALASAIVALARDGATRQAMGAAGRERVETEFTLERQAAAVDAAYADAISRRAGV